MSNNDKFSDKVAINYNENNKYNLNPPFNPSKLYPEFKIIGNKYIQNTSNKVYEAIRNILIQLKMDIENLDTAEWNPLGCLIKPGDTVALKPNLVMHEVGELIGQHTLCTDGSIIRGVLDYCALALKGIGKIIIADVPLQGADFQKIKDQLGLDSIISHCKELFNISIEIQDLRQNWAVLSEDASQIIRYEKLKGDPQGYTIVDLKENSLLDEISGENVRFSITDYDDSITNDNHQKGTHRYMISNTILNADVIINLPKLKTHQKAGITGAMKNFVGIIGSKDYLAHHRSGSVKRGGDEFPEYTWYNLLFKNTRKFLNNNAPQWLWKTVRFLGLKLRSFLASKNHADINPHIIGSGGWYGNDTVWRMIYDINQIFFFYNLSNEQIEKSKQRKYFCFVDAIKCGENNGPLSPQPKFCGMVVAGFDPLLIDAVCSRIMGFDWEKIPVLKNYDRFTNLTTFNGNLRNKILSNNESIVKSFDNGADFLYKFIPPSGWKNNIELN